MLKLDNLNDNLVNVLTILKDNIEPIWRLDSIAASALNNVRENLLNEEVIIVTFDMKVKKDKFILHRFACDQDFLRWFLIREDDIPLTFKIDKGADGEYVRELEDVNLIELDDQYKVDFREVAFILNTNFDIIYDYQVIDAEIIFNAYKLEN